MGEMFEDLLESLACARASSCTSNSSPPVRVAWACSSTRSPTRSGSAWASTPLWCHQAEAMTWLGGGESVVVATGNGVGQVARLPGRRSPRRWPASTRHRPARRSRPRPWPKTSCASIAAPGFPGLVAGDLRRRHRAPDAGVGPPPRQRRAHEPRDAPRRHPPAPRAVGDVPQAAAVRRDRRAARVPRHLRHPRRAPAAAAAPGLRALRLVADVHLHLGDRRRAGRLASGAVRAARRARSPTTGRRAASGCSRSGTLRCSIADTGDAAAHRTSRPRAADVAALLDDAGAAPSRSAAVARPPRSSPADVRRKLDADLAGRVRSYRGGYLARRASRDRGRAVRRASCAASSPPPRSSSASTSAGSTPACSTASPAPSRRCGSRPAGPGASRSSRWPCSSPATTSSTSGSWPTPTSCSPGRPSRRSINPANPFVLDPTSRARRTSCRSRSTTSGGGPTTARRRGARPRARRPPQCVRPTGARPLAVWAGRGRPAHGVGLRTGLVRRVPHRAATTARSSAPSTRPGVRGWCTPAPSTCTRASRTASRRLDLDDRAAIVEPVDGDEYTQARSRRHVAILPTDERRARSAACSCTSAPCE